MIEIELFGATTPSGYDFLQNFQSKDLNNNIYPYSRQDRNFLQFDLKKPNNFQTKITSNKGLWVSFAPIWDFSFFLEWIYKNKKKNLNNVIGILVCSSTSVVTKRFAYNDFDKKLVNNLQNSENIIAQISEQLNISCTIVRPTMIYGKSGVYVDKNFSLIKKALRYSPLLPLPISNGLRQPIHCNQLSRVVLKYVYKICDNKKNSIKKIEVINVGGDQEIKYFEMVVKLQKSLSINDPGRFCYVFLVPDSIFILLGIFSIFKSKKLFESLLRISSDMNGFIPSYKIIGGRKIKVPLIKKK